MKIIISPAKKMNTDTDTLLSTNSPIYLDRTGLILSKLQSLDYDTLKSIWKCNDSIATENHKRITSMNLGDGLTPALLGYDGIQYKYMSPTIFEDKMLRYVTTHLRILSGFYGVLKPLDGVLPYRLEMHADLSVAGFTNLYDYWGDSLYHEVAGDGVILNLASKEYSKCIERYLTAEDTMVTCVFGELVGEKLVQKATYAKMARGEMVRYLAENNIQDIEGVKGFHSLDFKFDSSRSDENYFVFLRNKDK